MRLALIILMLAPMAGWSEPWYQWTGADGQPQQSTSLSDVGTNAYTVASAPLSAEKPTPSIDLLIEAELFRQTIRLYFGAGAETNRAITAPVVKAYFVNKRYAGTITAADLADATLLDAGFRTLSAWTGDGTSWTFPFELIPTNLPAAVIHEP